MLKRHSEAKEYNRMVERGNRKSTFTPSRFSPKGKEAKPKPKMEDKSIKDKPPDGKTKYPKRFTRFKKKRTNGKTAYIVETSSDGGLRLLPVEEEEEVVLHSSDEEALEEYERSSEISESPDEPAYYDTIYPDTTDVEGGIHTVDKYDLDQDDAVEYVMARAFEANTLEDDSFDTAKPE